MNTKLHYIDCLRVFATFLVIMIHTSSMFISSQGLTISDDSFFLYNFMHVFCSFAVAVFIMITGALLLDPQKEISYERIFHRYYLSLHY